MITLDAFGLRTFLLVAPALVTCAISGDDGLRGIALFVVAFAGTQIGWHIGKREAK